MASATTNATSTCLTEERIEQIEGIIKTFEMIYDDDDHGIIRDYIIKDYTPTEQGKMDEKELQDCLDLLEDIKLYYKLYYDLIPRDPEVSKFEFFEKIREKSNREKSNREESGESD